MTSVGGALGFLLELLERRVAQQQPLHAGVGAEVDVGHGLVALALDAHDGAQAEGVVGDPVAAARLITGRLPGERTPGREARRATAGAEPREVTCAAPVRCQSTRCSGISSRNRLAGLYCGAPQAERTAPGTGAAARGRA